MKIVLIFLFAALLGTLGIAGYPGTTLFNDSYDRPNNTDIDASSTGMGGTLSPLVYVEAFEGSGAATSIQILSNQLNVAMGAGMSSLFLDHNFIDASLLTTDGFSVSIDVVGITTADDTGNRFGGFGIGHTRDEALAARDSFDSAAPFRPNLARAGQGIGVSDFYVDLALDMNLRVWSKGTLLETIAVGAASGTIRTDFYVPDFNAGSTVVAEVYFNGVKQATQSFTWDYTDANYLGISGRTAAAGVFLDNLAVATFTSEKANTPVPANGLTGVDPATLVLQWNKGKAADGNPNAAIVQHYLYINENEPNFVGITPITVADTDDPLAHNPASIDSSDTDKTYYWRVDESVLSSGSPTAPDDPNTLIGHVWSFETLKSIPVIDDQPVSQVVEPGQAAVFSITVSSISDVNYAWYKSLDNANNTAGDDALLSQAQELTVLNAQIGDEGYYFCKVTNSGGDTGAQYSDVVTLGIMRQLAYWTLDEADLQDGHYLDLSGEGHHADPNIIPTSSSFVSGADPAKTGDGLDLTIQPLAAADAGMWAPSVLTGQMTISAWVKWSGANGAWQGIVSNRITPTDGNFYIEIRQDNGNVQIGSPVFTAGDLRGTESSCRSVDASGGNDKHKRSCDLS